MIRQIMRDPMFLGQKSEETTKEDISIAEDLKDPKYTGNPTENTSLAPLQPEKPAEETKLRHLTDEEIIQGFRYLMRKDKKDK